MTLSRRTFLLSTLCTTVGLASATPSRAQNAPSPPPLSEDKLLTEVQQRAFRFFWEQSDPKTGLTNDRARNLGKPEEFTVASIASTGYALASLPIAVDHGWIPRSEAYARALLTLRFVHNKLPNEHGWHFHFIDKRTGERVWNCELSSIDTALLVIGAFSAGQYWPKTEVQSLANAVYDRMDWQWMLTNGGAKPDKRVLSMGWTPEKGFIDSNWDTYCELMFLYLLGLGAKNPLPADCWQAWKRNEIEYGGRKTLAGGPIFMHQMPQGYYDFKNQRDSLGWDYWVSSQQAVHINRQFCLDHADKRKTYTPDIWGLNASDGPDGYRAYGGPGDEDGTVSPTGAIASILFEPKLAKAAAQAIYTRYGDKLWGKYGFGNAFNVDRDWYGPDVIGIDLGMAMLAIENSRNGKPWKRLASLPATKRAWKLAGFHTTSEPEPRPLHSETLAAN